MKTHEAEFNYALGEVLQSRRRSWKKRVQSEKVGSILPKGRADNLIFPDDMQPVVVEAAFVGTPNIDKDAIDRLGKQAHNSREVMTAVALAIPESVRAMKTSAEIRSWLTKGGELHYAVYSLVKDKDHGIPECGYDMRYPDGAPNSGYISGSVADLADLIELAATPDKKIKQVAEEVGDWVCVLGRLLYESLPDFARDRIADRIGQPTDVHAMRVAACVWLNAIALHSKLAMEHKHIPSPFQAKGFMETVDAWERILKIDYNSVFRPALKSLEILYDYGVLAEHVLEELRGLVQKINALNLGATADISSDMFPKLATDRKVTAAYYTRMEVAELLSGLAFNLLPDNGHDLKIADFACGTGALLKAAYRQVRRRAEPKRGSDMSKLHRNYMENHLHGADIQPIAAHLTVAGLAGMHPAAEYSRSNVICTDITDGKAGSLDLLKGEPLVDLFGANKVTGVDGGSEQGFSPQDGTFDLCIMNPPYSRARGGSFVFGVEGMLEDQRANSLENLRHLLSDSFANMKAGMASAFCYLADVKLKQDGVLATVLPASAASQGSWRKFREHLVWNYSDIIVIGMASDKLQSFSADTGMGEILVCARKGKGTGEITFVNLRNLPRDFVEANEVARALRGVQDLKTGGELKIGKHAFATCIKMRPENGEAWGGVGARSHLIPGIAEKLLSGVLTLPGVSEEGELGMAVSAISKHMEVGPTHHRIGHLEGPNEKIGAFRFNPMADGKRTDLSLWDANAETQTRLICAPTCWGAINEGQEAEAKKMRDKKSTLFFARNLRLTSQKLAAAMTASPCMGGSAWAALLPFDDTEVCPAYCLWFNSIFGLLTAWQCGGKQHGGRIRMQISDIKNFPCPEFSGKTPAAKKAVKLANKEFSRLAKLELMPCSYTWRDENRKKIDAVVLRMLGLEEKFSEDEVQALREEWCQEPSVHGGNVSILRELRADKLV